MPCNFLHLNLRHVTNHLLGLNLRRPHDILHSVNLWYWYVPRRFSHFPNLPELWVLLIDEFPALWVLLVEMFQEGLLKSLDVVLRCVS